MINILIDKMCYIRIIKLVYLFLLSVFCSCVSNQEKQLEIALVRAGDHRGELEKVLTHYSKESEKLEAARFLIRNMLGKRVIDSCSIQKSNLYFEALGTYREKHETYINGIQYKICDSVKRLYPNIKSNVQYLYDLENLSADYLIRHIDTCFRIRQKYVWCKNLDKTTFYKYVLPYTINNGYWEQSMSYFQKMYTELRDTVECLSYKELGKHLSNHVDRIFFQNWDLFSLKERGLLPTSLRNLIKARIGTCLERSMYEITALRANGIPAVLNTFPCWGNYDGPHFWVEIVDEKQNETLYDNTQRPYRSKEEVLVNNMFWIDKDSPYLKDVPSHSPINYCRGVAKVYRVNYELQENSLGLIAKEEIPEFFKNPCIEDISDKYLVCKDIKVSLWNKIHPKRFVYLCCFNRGEWTPVDWSVPREDKASFKKMGVNLLYLPAYFDDNIVVPAGDAFVLEADGKMRILSGKVRKKVSEATFYMKTPYRLLSGIRASNMLGTRFFVCNRPDLSDTLCVCTIHKLPFYEDSFHIKKERQFRYLVCDFQKKLAPEGGPFSIAELKVYGKNQTLLTGTLTGTEGVSDYKLTNIMDGDRVSYYQSDEFEERQLIVLDFGEPKDIKTVIYYPRSDDNRIVTGELYELYYWSEKWISLGKQYGYNNKLMYYNIPENVIFKLHNHTRGKEHRPFTYEKGKQVWW